MQGSLFTVLVAGTQYLLHPQKLGTIQETIKPDALIPVTLLDTDEIFGDLEGILKLFGEVDDVFREEFSGVLIEKPSKNGSTVAHVRRTKREEEPFRLAADDGPSPFERLPSGPYFLHGPNLYQAWRLYDDNLEAFTTGVIPESINGTSDYFEALSSLSADGKFKSIAVPSRLYFPAPSVRKPLSGVRMSITDAAQLKGVHTTLSSRAWTTVYEEAAISTAPHVKALIDMGAVIVGKTKSSQFDSGREWVDIDAPWNPRGDGYQDPSWSAAGAGAGMSGYDWMQHSFALDAVEGVREQSDVHGLYSLRSTAGLASLKWWQVSSRNYDSAGMLSRDLGEMVRAAKAAFNLPDADVTLPTKLLYPLDFYPVISKEHQELDDKFVGVLEQLLGVKAERIDLAETWGKKTPKEANGQSLHEYLSEAPFESFCYEFYHKYDGFRKDYKSLTGREPFVEATPRFRWGVGEKESKADYDADQARIAVFRKWFSDNIMSTTSVADSKTIMVLPFGSVLPRYRDDPPGTPKAIDGLNPKFLAPLLGTPQFVAPFAQLPYNSRISGRAEYRPVSGSIMGPKGGDVMLIELVERAFRKANWLTKITTGTSAFPVEYKPS